MNIEQSRLFLIANAKPEYLKYIGERLAGDFAVHIATRLSDTQKELEKLQEREKVCPNVREAEHRALLRCVQEIAENLGMTHDVSPRKIVAKVAELTKKTSEAI